MFFIIIFYLCFHLLTVIINYLYLILLLLLRDVKLINLHIYHISKDFHIINIKVKIEEDYKNIKLNMLDLIMLLFLHLKIWLIEREVFSEMVKLTVNKKYKLERYLLFKQIKIYKEDNLPKKVNI